MTTPVAEQHFATADVEFYGTLVHTRALDLDSQPDGGSESWVWLSELTFEVDNVVRGDVGQSVKVLYESGWVHGPPSDFATSKDWNGRRYRVAAERFSPIPDALGKTKPHRTNFRLVAGPCTLPAMVAVDGED